MTTPRRARLGEHREAGGDAVGRVVVGRRRRWRRRRRRRRAPDWPDGRGGGPSARSLRGRTRCRRARRKILPYRGRGWGARWVGGRRRVGGAVEWSVAAGRGRGARGDARLRGRRGRHPARAARRPRPPGLRHARRDAARPGPLVGVPGAAARGAGRAGLRRRRARWRAGSPAGRSACRRSTSRRRSPSGTPSRCPTGSSRCIPSSRCGRWRPRWTSRRRSPRAAPGQRIAALARWVDPAVALGDLPAGRPPRRRARRAGRRLVGGALGARGGRGARRRARRPRPPHADRLLAGAAAQQAAEDRAEVGPALLLLAGPARRRRPAPRRAGRPAGRRGRRPAPRSTWPR